ncbi:hypothetical protein [Mucilaginibacter myungsuensis]|uniref:Uncharacterized protein n=1 Tax=Mucilaginibacter myungsuensis TaxID=649104 RepID=A0A929PVV7_9SPHI|nr:hypothetical protein [Mucilaginibacter myungsuensis]MBE9661431.1 hypothetical protein [Mucilaginibacter myungsuensis]MDN3597574.1 hypothetical protein [Mucilaginibacter myungsuensis]
MARSKRKTPIFGQTTASSEKLDKRRWNRVFRRITKTKLGLEDETPVRMEEVSNVWDGAKDGKHYYSGHTLKDLRK